MVRVYNVMLKQNALDFTESTVMILNKMLRQNLNTGKCESNFYIKRTRIEETSRKRSKMAEITQSRQGLYIYKQLVHSYKKLVQKRRGLRSRVG